MHCIASSMTALRRSHLPNRPGLCSLSTRFLVPVSTLSSSVYCLSSHKGLVKDSLLFVVKYRLLREEVAGIIEEQVRAALNDAGKSQDLRPTVVTKLIEALERDPSWVSMYNITGEIKVPETKAISKADGEVVEILETASKVGSLELRREN